jgi:hypothetical protein
MVWTGVPLSWSRRFGTGWSGCLRRSSQRPPATSTLLAEQGALLGEPSTRQLDGKLRELRFHLDGNAVRLTHWIAPGRRIVLLTVFGKTRMREAREVARARRAWQRCMAEAHTVDELVERNG